jgi:Outer membrane protein beta-barrel domain
MNKINGIVVICIMTFCQFANAQTIKGGLKIGANLTKIDGVTFKDGYQLAYQAGGFLEIDITKKFGIQPELLFSQTTSTTETATNAIYQNILQQQNLQLQYISIPILFRYNVNKLLTLQVGPQYSIQINHGENLTYNGKNAFKNGDFGMIGGAQINLKSLRVYGRYHIGLSNLNDIDNKESWRTQQIQLGVGFAF